MFIYLFGLSCGMQDLSVAWHENTLAEACGIQFPDQGSNLGPLALRTVSLSHWTTREVLSPVSLITGNSLHSASMTFPEFQRADSSNC